MDKIKMVSEIGGSLISSVISVLGGDVASLLLSSAVEPVVRYGFENIISKKDMTQRECQRLGVSYRAAVSKINENIAQGLPLRSDDMFSRDKSGYAKADDIIEGVLKDSINDTEHKKSIYYGYFVANLAFAPEIGYGTAIHIRKIVEGLTYYNLCGIKFLNTVGVINVDGIIRKEININNLKRLDVYHSMKELVRFDLIEKVPPYTLGEEIGNIKLGILGNAIYKLLDLNDVNDTDLADYYESV